MLDIKQNRDLITVYCDHCASTIKLYASDLNGETLRECVEGHGWLVKETMDFGVHIIKDDEHVCRSCLRKGVK